MADIKEKLVELLAGLSLDTYEDIVYVAEHIIAKGVTIQEWISVEEALPDDSVEVILCTRSGIVVTGYYDKYRKNWVQYYAGGALCVVVTHWMPMPEPPKGE